jgi:hypothetical protein
MSPERTSAYRRVTQTLAELGPSKLWDGEQDRIRYAADTLIFCSGLPADEAARNALADAELLVHDLVESERWTQPTADRLLGDLRACGPAEAVVQLEAA